MAVALPRPPTVYQISMLKQGERMLKRREKNSASMQHIAGGGAKPENSGIEACRYIGTETNKKLFHELFQHRTHCGQSKPLEDPMLPRQLP